MGLSSFVIILCIIYVVPFLRLFTWVVPVSFGNGHIAFNAYVGRCEWFIGPVRDLGIAVVLFAAAIWDISYTLFQGFELNISLVSAAAAAVALSVFAKVMKRRHRRGMLVFGCENPQVSPSEFFDLYYAGYGIFPVSIPKKAKSVIDPVHVSFKTGTEPVRTLRPILPGIWNTHTLARLVWEAFVWKGSDHCRRAADSLSAIWGARVLEIASMELMTEGLEKIAHLDRKNNKFIFVFNHHSFVDFAVSPVSLCAVLDDGLPRFHPRYLAAKDHFKDNWFLYRALGLGRALEAIGTIFVERRSKERDPGETVRAAATSVMGSGVDIAMYPQGTRALGNLDADGNRVDGAYYAVGRADRLKRDGAHIKKGAAYLAIEILKQLKDGQSLYIVPVGLLGTGVVCPSKSMRVQTETTVRVVIGEPIRHGASDLVGYDAERSRELADLLTKQIDDGLKSSLKIDERLAGRFVTDAQTLEGQGVAAAITERMADFDSRNNLVSKTLDHIYSLPPSEQGEWIPGLIRILKDPNATDEDILRFKGAVIDALIKTR